MNTENTQKHDPYHRKEAEAPAARRYSRGKPIVIALLLVLLFGALLVVALRPRQLRNQEVMESLERTQGTPTVLVTKAKRLPARGDLVLPGTIQALNEAPIFARSEGYLRKRLADIGDSVKAGQLLAVIEAPEVDKQVQQARAAVSRAEASLAQAKAALEQSTTQMKLAEVTSQRWNALFARKVVSRQEADEKQAAYEARRADSDAAKANVAAATQSVAASQADLQRLSDLKGFQEVYAPFAGVITARNTDVGALIRSGASEGRELFRLAGIDTVRIMVQVPQTNVPAIQIGESAQILLQEMTGRSFTGRIVRTANSLDPATRTLLVEIHVSNPERILLPGMYAQVLLAGKLSAATTVVSGDTLVIRSDGPQVAVVQDGGKIHYQKVLLGRDFGAETEVTSGLDGGELLVINPGDDIREGAVIKPRMAKETAPAPKPAK